MNNDNRRRLLLLAVWAGVVLLSTAIRIDSLAGWKTALQLLAESIIYLTFVLLFSEIPTLRCLLRSVSRRYTASLGVALVLCFIAQLSKTDFFPFVKWHMYSYSAYGKPKYVRYYEYVGVTRGGDRILITPPHIVPSLRRSRLLTRLKDYDVGAHTGEPHGSSTAAEMRHQYHNLLAALGKLYNNKRIGEPIRSIEVYLCQFDTSSTRVHDAAITRQIRATVEIN